MSKEGRIYKMPMHGRWVRWTDRQMELLKKKGDTEKVDRWMAEWEKYQVNRLAYVLPHGMPWRGEPIDVGGGLFQIAASDYPKSYGNDGVAFLNDWTHEIGMVVAPNQVGKSFLGAVWTALRIVPTQPDWMVFTHHGVKHVPWGGPKVWVVSSYSWDNVTTVWRRYQEILPREELGQYAADWGRRPGDKGAPKVINFGHKPTVIVPLACGSALKFLCYTQPDFHWEGFEADGWHADEQPGKQNFIGITRAFTTRGDYTPMCFTLTGHVVEDRPDTGATGFVKRELWDGANTYGRTVGRYHISLDDVPDAILTPKKRKELYDQWANPEKHRSERDERAAVARYWGGWEVGGGMVLGEWRRDVHMIEPFPIPKHWTRFRMVDHGEKPCAALRIALSPYGDAVAYAEYYEYNKTVGENAKAIVEWCGNRTRKYDTFEDRDGVTWPLCEEVFHVEQYLSSVLDGRSFAQKKTGGLTIGTMYRNFGLTVSPANMARREGLIPLLAQWLKIDTTRKHIQTGAWGAPRLYVFNTLTNFRNEIEGWAWKTGPSGRLTAADKDDHLMSCALFWVAQDPQYMGDQWNGVEETEERDGERGVVTRGEKKHDRKGGKYTGYVSR